MAELFLYLGGAKSGKTRLALSRTETYPAPRFYVATAEALDGEMTQRIINHQAERGPDWVTLEAPLEPDLAIAGLRGDGPVMLDCITIWLSNLLGQMDQAAEIDIDYVLSRIDRLADVAKRRSSPVIVVSNEVGGGIVPMNELARKFRDLAGAANQRLAAWADEVYLSVAGLPLRLK